MSGHMQRSSWSTIFLSFRTENERESVCERLLLCAFFMTLASLFVARETTLKNSLSLVFNDDEEEEEEEELFLSVNNREKGGIVFFFFFLTS